MLVWNKVWSSEHKFSGVIPAVIGWMYNNALIFQVSFLLFKGECTTMLDISGVVPAVQGWGVQQCLIFQVLFLLSKGRCTTMLDISGVVPAVQGRIYNNARYFRCRSCCPRARCTSVSIATSSSRTARSTCSTTASTLTTETRSSALSVRRAVKGAWSSTAIWPATSNPRSATASRAPTTSH